MGKRNKGYYYKKGSQSKKGRYEQVLQAGMKGFLITCGNKAEKDVKREAYSILNEYADMLYGPEKSNKDDLSDEEVDDEEEDIEKALKKEVEAMKKKTKSTVRRFQAVDAGANNCVFIKTTVDNPAELLCHIITDLHTTKVAKSRHIMKIFPVIASCKCDDDKIKKVASECFEKTFKDVGEFTYCFNFKIRNNTGMNRAKALPIMCDVFTELGLKSTVEYNNPDYIVSVDIIKSVCCFSVLKDFSKYRKYNLQEIVAVESKSFNKTGETSSKDEKEADKIDENESLEKVSKNEDTEGTNSCVESQEVDKIDENEGPEKYNKSEETDGTITTTSGSESQYIKDCELNTARQSSETDSKQIEMKADSEDQIQPECSRDIISKANKVEGETSDL